MLINLVGVIFLPTPSSRIFLKSENKTRIITAARMQDQEKNYNNYLKIRFDIFPTAQHFL